MVLFILIALVLQAVEHFPLADAFSLMCNTAYAHHNGTDYHNSLPVLAWSLDKYVQDSETFGHGIHIACIPAVADVPDDGPGFCAFAQWKSKTDQMEATITAGKAKTYVKDFLKEGHTRCAEVDIEGGVFKVDYVYSICQGDDGGDVGNVCDLKLCWPECSHCVPAECL